ncbi:unnamed protein product, partial [Porites lobata]
MASFQKLQELLLPCLEEEIIDDEEFSVLYEAYAPQNLPFQHSAYEKFSLENKNSAECKADFRVDKRDIALLVEALRVTRWNHGILNPPLMATYADGVHSKGAALDNCFGFIDGTVRPISRPMSNQRVVYNGHKRVHALKFQAVTLPNGLIANIYGPVEGRMHDARMLAVSQLYDDLQNFAFDPVGRAMCLYGDPAYPLRNFFCSLSPSCLQAPFRVGILTRDMEMFNESMSAVRSSVEWLFGDI